MGHCVLKTISRRSVISYISEFNNTPYRREQHFRKKHQFALFFSQSNTRVIMTFLLLSSAERLPPFSPTKRYLQYFFLHQGCRRFSQRFISISPLHQCSSSHNPLKHPNKCNNALRAFHVDLSKRRRRGRNKKNIVPVLMFNNLAKVR